MPTLGVVLYVFFAPNSFDNLLKLFKKLKLRNAAPTDTGGLSATSCDRQVLYANRSVYRSDIKSSAEFLTIFAHLCTLENNLRGSKQFHLSD